MKPISNIDAKNGILYFRGRDAIHLARNHSFEEVLFLLVNKRLPNEEENRALRRRLAELRHIVEDEIAALVTHDEVSGLQHLALRLEILTKEHSLTTHDSLLLFVAMAPSIVAAEWRKRIHGENPVLPRDTLSHLENLPWMLDERERTSKWNRDFETCIILHMDDPDNPSLTALLESYQKMGSVSASLSLALDRHIHPLHHGAGELAMKMVREIEEPARTCEVIEQRIERGERIYGLGHRIYRTIDPRAAYLSQMLDRLTSGTENEWINDVIKSIREIGPEIINNKKGITVFPNVDLYNAAVYHALGFPEEMNTYLFAIARTAGWMAHIMEYERS